MAISDAYATFAEFQANTNQSSSGDQSLVERLLVASSRYLDRECGQFFGKDASPVARYLRGSGTDTLLLRQGGAPGIASQSGFELIIDENDDGLYTETAIEVATLRFWPLNAALNPEPAPWTEVQLTSSSRLGIFPSNVLVKVTAAWGWPSVPTPIRESCIELAAIWLSKSPRATGAMNELDQVVQSSPLANSLVKRFRGMYRMPVIA